MKTPYFTALAVILCSTVVQNVAVARQAYPHTTRTAQVDRLFASWDRTGSPGAAVGIIKDGRIIYARGYGMANLEYDIPNTPQTVFRIGSTSKHFTAMAIAVLDSQGELSLDDDIRRYLPEIPAYEWPVTIRHMLHHTSGLRNYEVLMSLAGRDGPTHPVPYYTDAEAVDIIARQKALNFRPGDRYSYSNSNYFLLAEIIGRVSGMRTAEFARQYLFEPLGMTATHFHDDVDVIVKNRASGYSPTGDGGFRVNMTKLPQIGTGSIFTTIDDFYKWDRNFYDNVLGDGSQDLIDRVQTPGRLNDGGSTHYGFGLDIRRFHGLRSIGHGGAFVGFRSYYLRFPEQRFSVVVLANQGPFPDRELAEDIATIYLEDQFTEPRDAGRQTYRDDAGADTGETEKQPVSLSRSERAGYAGRYYSHELDATYALHTESDTLVLQVGRYHKEVVVATGPDTLTWSFGTLRAERGGTNDVTGLVLDVDGLPIRNIRFMKVHDR